MHRSSAGSPPEASSRAPLPAGFGTIWSTVAIDLVGFGIVLPILPQYAERFGATPTTIGLLVASFSVAQLVFSPVMGRLSDAIGRKPVLVVSLFGTAIGSLLTGVAGSVALLFVGRIIDGASGASVSVAQAAAADLASPRERTRLLGLLGAAFGVGFVAGPAIGSLAALGGAHVPFLVAAAISFVNALVALFRLPETHTRGAGGSRGGSGTPDGAGLRDAERIADAPALDGPGIVEPAHLGALPRAHDASGSLGAGRPAILRLIAVAFVGVMAFSGFEATFSLLTKARLGLELAATAAVFTVIGAFMVLVQVRVVGPVSDRLGELGTLRAGFGANLVGFAVLAADGGWTTFTVALVLIVAGQGLLTPALSSAVAGLAGDRRGAWLGWQQSAGGLARVVGPVGAGVLFEHVGVGAPSLLAAAFSVAALAMVPTRSRLP